MTLSAIDSGRGGALVPPPAFPSPLRRRKKSMSAPPGQAEDTSAEDIDDLILPELAELVNAAAREQGVDLSIDADALRKILAYVSGERVHGGQQPPAPGPSPVAQSKSLSTIREPDRPRISLPPVRQTRPGLCGPAILRSVLSYWGVDPGPESDLTRAIGASQKNGVGPDAIAAEAIRNGLSASVSDGMTVADLTRAVKDGVPVICAVQAYGGRDQYAKAASGHYVAVTAVDDGKVFFEDPSIRGGRGYMPESDFVARWIDEDSDGVVRRGIGITIRGRRSQKDNPPERATYVKSLFVSPFRGRSKAFKLSRSGKRCYDDSSGKLVRTAMSNCGGPGEKPSQPKQHPVKIPDWESLKDRYKNPGQWLEATFKTEEERDAARATDSYRKIVEQWADEKGRQWGAGDPREKDKPQAMPGGPGAPGWVDVTPTLSGADADRHVADVLRKAGGEASYAKSVHKAVRNMPRRARDLLADGLNKIHFADTLPDLTLRYSEDTPRVAAAFVSRRPADAAADFRSLLESAEIPDATLRGRLSAMAALPDLEERIAEDGPVRNVVTTTIAKMLKHWAASVHGNAGGIYEENVGEVYLNGPTSTVLKWVEGAWESPVQTARELYRDVVNPTGEGRYQIKHAADVQTDVYAHELTHAIDRGGRFSKTGAWGEAWRADLGGDESLQGVFATGKHPGRKLPLTYYAATSPSEGFAEVGRLLYSGDCDLTEFEKRFPKVSGFFRSNGLWPGDTPDGKRTELDDVFIGSVPSIGELNHADILAGAWKEWRDLFTGRAGR